MENFVIIYYRDFPPDIITIPQNESEWKEHFASRVKKEVVTSAEIVVDNVVTSTYNGSKMKWTRS